MLFEQEEKWKMSGRDDGSTRASDCLLRPVSAAVVVEALGEEALGFGSRGGFPSVIKVGTPWSAATLLCSRNSFTSRDK